MTEQEQHAEWLAMYERAILERRERWVWVPQTRLRGVIARALERLWCWGLAHRIDRGHWVERV